MRVHAPSGMVERGVRRFEVEARRRKEEAAPKGPRVITISRQLGSGGSRIAEILGKTLGWLVWDREILDVLASQSRLGYQAAMFESLDEKARGDIETVIQSTFRKVDKHTYFYLLPKAILIIAQNDAIVLGRAAHLLLPDALRVRIEASLDSRVKNLGRLEGLTEEVAQERMRTSDRERSAFLREFAARIAHRPLGMEKGPEYDLVVNTDRFGIQGAASIILTAATKRFHLEQPVAGCVSEVYDTRC